MKFEINEHTYIVKWWNIHSSLQAHTSCSKVFFTYKVYIRIECLIYDREHYGERDGLNIITHAANGSSSYTVHKSADFVIVFSTMSACSQTV